MISLQRLMPASSYILPELLLGNAEPLYRTSEKGLDDSISENRNATARFQDKVKNERHAIESVDVLEAAIKPCRKDYAQGQAQSRLRNSPTSLTCRAQTSFAHFELRDLHDGFGSSRGTVPSL
ncbi:hypothetical protein ED733_000283 [Metarhizium rileyi]|uniref:Uncharacterized protein n=1 Tax=Metarhizium rileyi (strain RCEF 4871) TaxID=1649241 RepID=A0A5C6G4Q4_METRR|nr:hypothetical protein ED733_000283 [Metarhizium rileyi]